MAQFKIKSHMLLGIKWMLPLVVSAGMAIAIGSIMENLGFKNVLSKEIVQLGVVGFSLMVPVITAAIAFSIAGFSGMAPGLIIGMMANHMGTGYLGGLLFGFLVGYCVVFLNKYLQKVFNNNFKALLPVLIVPTLTLLIIGLLGYFFIGVPIVWLMERLKELLDTMQTGGKFMLGFIQGGMSGVDFGGPVNKTASLFADGLLVSGIYGPEAVKVMAAMVPPFGVALSVLWSRKKWNKADINQSKIAFPLGLCMITEGVIPIALNDPFRVIFASVVGGGVAGGLSMILDVGSRIPSGGVFIIPFTEKPLYFTMCLIIGSIVTAIILSALKKEVSSLEEDDKKAEKLLSSEDLEI